MDELNENGRAHNCELLFAAFKLIDDQICLHFKLK